jgi:acylphosphatase
MPLGADQAMRAVVHGRVQGVGFRWSAVREARRLGVRGTVANRWDGSVEIVAEGGMAAMESFLAWLRTGPPGARVSEVTVDRIPATGRYTGFEIEYQSS